MKFKILSLAAATALFFSCGTPSYTSTSANSAYSVPATLQSSFTTQYPGATNVVWTSYDATVESPVDWQLNGWSSLDAADHTVTFDMDGNQYYAWYDSDGSWVGSTYTLSDYTKLPSAVQSSISQKYSGYTIEKAHQEMWKDHTAYEVKLKNGDAKKKILIDDQGTVLKEKDK